MHLTVAVCPAHRPGRWAWRLVDRRDGSELEIGFDYASPSEARRDALARLAELTVRLPGATTAPPYRKTA